MTDDQQSAVPIHEIGHRTLFSPAWEVPQFRKGPGVPAPAPVRLSAPAMQETVQPVAPVEAPAPETATDSSSEDTELRIRELWRDVVEGRVAPLAGQIALIS